MRVQTQMLELRISEEIVSDMLCILEFNNWRYITYYYIAMYDVS